MPYRFDPSFDGDAMHQWYMKFLEDPRTVLENLTLEEAQNVIPYLALGMAALVSGAAFPTASLN